MSQVKSECKLPHRCASPDISTPPESSSFLLFHTQALMYTVKRKSDVGAAGEDETSNGGKRVKSSEPAEREEKENEVKKEGAGEGEAEKKPERLKPYKECTFSSLPPPPSPAAGRIGGPGHPVHGVCSATHTGPSLQRMPKLKSATAKSSSGSSTTTIPANQPSSSRVSKSSFKNSSRKCQKTILPV